VVLYTAVGGLKATFLTDFLHTAIALILIIYFTIAVLTNSAIGGLGGLWEKVMATAGDNLIPGNYEGSLLTFKCKDAIIWGLILKFGNLALVVMVSSIYMRSLKRREKRPPGLTIPGRSCSMKLTHGQ
jgi:Na+/proline symporter